MVWAHDAYVRGSLARLYIEPPVRNTGIPVIPVILATEIPEIWRYSTLFGDRNTRLPEFRRIPQ